MPFLRLLSLAFCVIALSAPSHAAASRPPNIIFILADDLGYGDIGAFGQKIIRTPNLDRFAAEGLKFTQHYSGNNVCAPSRCVLMTGKHPGHAFIRDNRELKPEGQFPIPADTVTLPKLLKAAGYATGLIGKWHLGAWANDRPQHHPLDHGFDFHFGLMHSNDMNPSDQPKPKKANALVAQDPAWWNAALYRGRELLEPRTDQTRLTRRYAEEAVKFIGAHKDKPFFLYLPHTFPHTPLFASERFQGSSARGIYGDVVGELDESVGAVLQALRDQGVAENTLVVFTSDNGPWTWMGAETGGSAGLLRDGKGSTWEGGMRVPGIAWWPGRIKPGVTSQVASTLDLFPTFPRLAGAELPDDRPMDWADLSPLLLESKPLEREVFCYYRGTRLFAARLGPWKAHFQTQGSYGDPKVVTHEPPLLFNLEVDPSESHDVAAQYPEQLARIIAAVERHRAKLTVAPSQLVETTTK